ncbi:MAG TPA: dihydrodipicolinate reductase C-terminal domain-containing protein [Gemmatimonadaceae bacterium]|jgi:4-hydroxy-tetrahydrodipicolinate reductase|nr:dihydrodipicolinate reductase C-terminal domain-containing protein [Gemmatimonadaceae bacterium]
MSETIPLALIGMGKMGRTLATLAPDAGFRVVAELDANRPDYTGITRESLGGAHVAIEFTTPGAAAENARACARAGCPVVVGTTGWYQELDAVATDVERAGGAILTAPNFSVGVAVFDKIVAEASRLYARLPRFADAHLVETHHAEKKDAPSGTAGALARTASAALGRDVPITSVRVGHVPGTHELIFDSAFEQVRLVHEARDRRVFAEGALLAAKWLVGRRGRFTLNDVLDDSVITSP